MLSEIIRKLGGVLCQLSFTASQNISSELGIVEYSELIIPDTKA